MLRRTIIGIVISLLLSDSSLQAQQTTPADSTGIILVINSCDPDGFHARKKKEALFRELADTLRICLADQSQVKYGFTAKTISLFIPEDGSRGQKIDSLLALHQAGFAILFDTLDVYFEQTHVDVSGTKGSKERIAYYDICANVHYQLYMPGKLMKSDLNKTREFFTSRSVISGFFASGPDIVAKKKYAFGMLDKNAHAFLWANDFYFPGH